MPSTATGSFNSCAEAIVLFVPLLVTFGRSSIMNKNRSEAPFVVVSCTAPMPSGASFGTESWNVTLPEPGSFVLSDKARATFAGKLVHNSSAPFRFSPKKATVVVLPGDTAEGDA